MIYIHIPFCKSRCLYCDFFSSTSEALMEQYTAALQGEISHRREELLRARANTLYIGGGTPSRLPVALLQRIFDSIQEILPIEDRAEVTLECNPDDVTPQRLNDLIHTPVNRISMGVQTLCDDLLRLLNRRHTAMQARTAVDLLRGAGYENLSLDLMYGLPGQSMELWKKDVREILAMQVPHLSAYSLQWEEGTALYKMKERGEVSEADEELSLQMYRFLCDETAGAGMEHYEISNFAMPGKRARHNSGYWRNEPYVGLGPGAHSYDGGRLRSCNPADLHSYISSQGRPVQETEHLSDGEWYEEQILKGLRTIEGVDLKSLPEDYAGYAKKMALGHIKAGRLALDGSILRLTGEGIFVSNDVMSDLML